MWHLHVGLLYLRWPRPLWRALTRSPGWGGKNGLRSAWCSGSEVEMRWWFNCSGIFCHKVQQHRRPVRQKHRKWSELTLTGFKSHFAKFQPIKMTPRNKSNIIRWPGGWNSHGHVKAMSSWLYSGYIVTSSLWWHDGKFKLLLYYLFYHLHCLL